MTDADVDGSHIRTLLLTFFYRQMPRTGRARARLHRPAAALSHQERQESCATSVMRRSSAASSCAGRRRITRSRWATAKKTRLEGGELTKFLMALAEYVELFDKIEKRLGDARPSRPCSKAELRQEDGARGQGLNWSWSPGSSKPKASRLSPALDEEHNLYRLAFSSETLASARSIGNWSPAQITGASRTSTGSRCANLTSHLSCIVHQRQSDHHRGPPAELLDHIMALGKKAFTVQRFKGLGEMNPNQLWETTMDAEHRMLLQVKSRGPGRGGFDLHGLDGRRRRTPPPVHRRQRAGREEPGYLTAAFCNR